jgi:hypothetical protein
VSVSATCHNSMWLHPKRNAFVSRFSARPCAELHRFGIALCGSRRYVGQAMGSILYHGWYTKSRMMQLPCARLFCKIATLFWICWNNQWFPIACRQPYFHSSFIRNICMFHFHDTDLSSTNINFLPWLAHFPFHVLSILGIHVVHYIIISGMHDAWCPWTVNSPTLVIKSL